MRSAEGEDVTLISAVIPVHNRFEFLDETITSVFAQTRVPDEVVIVDDWSSIPVEEHLKRNPPPGPVTVLHTERHSSPGGARNRGWRQAKGDLIAFNDSDDLWEPDKTRLQSEYLEAHPEVDGVYGPMIAFFPDGRTQPWAHDRPPVVDAATGLMDANITSQTLMIRRRALEILGGFDESLPLLQDQPLAIEIGLKGLNVVFLYSPVVTRVRRHDRNSSGHAEKYFLCACRIALRYRRVSARIYGPGSFLVHLSRALKRYGHRRRFMGLPTRAIGSCIAMLAPASRMPREVV